MRKLLLITILFFSINSLAQSPMFRLIGKHKSGNFVIDSLSSAAAQTAHSLRKVRSAYAGYCIRVKRSSDNTEQDIGFINNFVDTVSVKTFIGASDGLVTIWYDQTGNSRDLTPQTTGGKIATGGVLTYHNSRLCIYMNGTGESFKTASYTAYPDSITLNAVMKVSSNSSFNAIMAKTNSNLPNPVDAYSQSYAAGNGTNFTNRTPSTTFNAASNVATWTIKASSPTYTGLAQMWKNTTNILNNTTAYYGDGNRPVYLGSRQDLATAFIGYAFEAFSFSAINSTDITKLQNNQIALYGL